MSNLLPKTLAIDRSALRGLKTVPDVVQWLESFVKAIDSHYAKLRDAINNSGMGTPNWDIREGTADDVTAGNAQVAGNLIVINKSSGVKHEFEP